MVDFDVGIFKHSISNKTKEEFYGELFMMLSAGMDIRSSLDIYVGDIASKKNKALFTRIKEAVITGSPLSKALMNEAGFSAYEYQNILIGEESGNLVNVLNQLAKYFKTKTEQRRQIIGALSYPILVLVTSLGAVGFMLQVVVPMFEDVFKRFGSDLPWMTKTVIRMADAMSNYFMFILLLLVIILTTAHVLRNNILFRKYRSQLVIGLPFFGDIVKSAMLARFASAMHLLISSKYPLLQSLVLVKGMVQFYPIEASLDRAEGGILAGNSLHSMFHKESFYPKKMVALIKMGEEVNKLDIVFSQLRDQYDAEVKYRSSLLTNVLEPVLIIFIGAAVGFILISMYLPLFELSSGLK
ncbi:MAG: type II secretion system F family protein [Salibacteraceae bacterium]